MSTAQAISFTIAGMLVRACSDRWDVHFEQKIDDRFETSQEISRKDLKLTIFDELFAGSSKGSGLLL